MCSIFKRVVKYFICALVLYFVLILIVPSYQPDHFVYYFQISSQKSLNIQTTRSTTPSTTSTTSSSTSTRAKRPYLNEMSAVALNQLVYSLKPMKGRFNFSFRYDLKDMLDVRVLNNPLNYDFISEPSIKECSGQKRLFILSVVFVGADFVHRRSLIRQTWANRSMYDPYDLQVIFAVGLSGSNQTNARILEEQRVHNDILFMNYTDSYHLLTSKLRLSLKWMKEKCSNADLFLRINDDVLVNTLDFIQRMKKIVSMTNGKPLGYMMMGMMLYDSVAVRDIGSKWYVAHADYKAGKYLPYCEGSVYVLTRDLAIDMLSVSYYVNWPPFSVWLEDIYTGLLCNHMQCDFVPLDKYFSSTSQFLTDEKIVREKNTDNLLFIYAHQDQEIQLYWKIITNSTIKIPSL